MSLWQPGARGFSLLEVMFALALIVTVVGMSIAAARAAALRSTGVGAARYVAARMALARAQAIARSAAVALHFTEGPRGIEFSTVVDGNRNGVRTADIERGLDFVAEPPVLLSDLFSGASIGVVLGAPVGDPVQLGGTSILSFSRNGTSTSGSVYVRGPDDVQYVLRVLGATARTRLHRYDPLTAGWVNVE